jgi:hypothetical protein
MKTRGNILFLSRVHGRRTEITVDCDGEHHILCYLAEWAAHPSSVNQLTAGRFAAF